MACWLQQEEKNGKFMAATMTLSSCDDDDRWYLPGCFWRILMARNRWRRNAVFGTTQTKNRDPATTFRMLVVLRASSERRLMSSGSGVCHLYIENMYMDVSVRNIYTYLRTSMCEMGRTFALA